jgi:cytochrome c oxidase assembly protein subunit 15
MYDLHPLLVSAHFALSMLILACATFSWQAAGSGLTVRMRSWGTWAMSAIALPVCAGVITAGILTTASGPHSGSEPGSPVSRLAHGSLVVAVHARGAYVFAALVVALTLLARRSRAGARDLTLLTGLIALQITLGEIQYRNGLPWGVVLAHVATASAIWVTTCRIAFASTFTMETERPAPLFPSRTRAHEEALT